MYEEEYMRKEEYGYEEVDIFEENGYEEDGMQRKTGMPSMGMMSKMWRMDSGHQKDEEKRRNMGELKSIPIFLWRRCYSV